jgi:hypothetical protein
MLVVWATGPEATAPKRCSICRRCIVIAHDAAANRA